MRGSEVRFNDSLESKVKVILSNSKNANSGFSPDKKKKYPGLLFRLILMVSPSIVLDPLDEL